MNKKDARRFLQRMIKANGFIADGVYEEYPRYWHSNNAHSARMIDLGLFGYLQREKLIARDRTGRYLVTEKGAEFAKPWYQRWFALS